MKRLFLLCLFILFSNTGYAFTFKIATISPEGSFWMEKMREAAKEIETKTEKRVSFKFYPGGVMGDDKSVLKKMRFNQLQGAALTNSGLSSLYSDIQLYNLVLKFQSLDEVDYVRKQMDDKLIEGLKQQGISTFGFVELGLTYLMSTSPIYSLADMKDQKAWAPENNEIAIEAQKAFSVASIPLPVRDVLMGLQTGMINVVAGSPVGALALQWHTKIKYVNKLPLSYVFGVFVLNQKDLKRLSEDDQKIVKNTMARVIKEANERNRDDNQKAIQALKNQGIQFLEPTPEAADELRALTNKLEPELINSGILSKDLVDELNQHLKDFRSR